MRSVGGVVLCGGRSSRMGQPKAWLPVGGEAMLARVVRLLGEVVAPVVVVAAPDQDLPPLLSAAGTHPPTVVRDAIEGQGPLQGLAAGLGALHGKVEAAYLSSCDTPFLRVAFVRRMIELLGSHSICVPRVGDRLHPLAAVYRTEVGSVAARLLAEDRRRLTLLLDEVPTRIVGPGELADVDPTFQSLRNLNTPAEYEEALRGPMEDTPR